MASPEETARRAHWRAHFDPARPLAEQLDKPWIDMWQVAHIMGISEASAYKSAKRFHAAMLTGDWAAAAREVPCIVMGRTHRVPRTAFELWWGSAGGAMLAALTERQDHLVLKEAS